MLIPKLIDKFVLVAESQTATGSACAEKDKSKSAEEPSVQPSETPSTWVEDEPDAVAVGSTDWGETVKDGAVSATSETPRAQSLDKPRSFESASCKSAKVHFDSLGMEDVTLESPLFGEVGEQSAEGDPGASPAPARLDFAPLHRDVAKTAAAAEETGGISTETLGQTVWPGT